MRVDEPSDLAFAAFFADCEHEVRLVEAGAPDLPGVQPGETTGQGGLRKRHRTLRKKPPASLVNSVDSARNQGEWERLSGYWSMTTAKAGLSFDTLKNVDASVARVLLAAAAASDCILHAATISICEDTSVEHYGGWHVREIEDVNESEYEVIETIDVSCALENLTGPDGTTSDTMLPLREGELMPKGCLDDEEPDEHRLTEATGNAGATVERIYRRAALVLWHRVESLHVLEDAGTEPMISFLADECKRASEGEQPSAPLILLARQCAEGWPLRKLDSSSWEENSERLLDILFMVGAWDAAEQFVLEKLLPSYPGVRSSDACKANTVVVRATSGIGIERMQDHLVTLVHTSVSQRLDALVELADTLHSRVTEESERRAIQVMVLAICKGLASFPVRYENEHTGTRRFYFLEVYGNPVKIETLHRLYALVWGLGHQDAGEVLTTTLVGRPDLVRPCHELPDLLESLYCERREWAREDAFATMWRHCAECLLSRSASAPEPPADWSVSIDGLDCGCPHCVELRAFCVDPVTRVTRFAVRQALRGHLRQQIQSARTDIEFETERKGSPHKLVCTKVRRSHELRHAEYIGDLDRIRRLVSAADAVQASDDIVRALRSALQAGSSDLPDGGLINDPNSPP